MNARNNFDAIVIGAGFSGLAILHHLREIGLSTLVVDAQDGVGGTWWANRYPGVRTDSEFSYYSFSFSKEVREEWTWTQRYPAGDEVLAYLNFVADRLDLRRDIRLNTRIESARYDEDSNTWTVQTADGDSLVAKYLVSGMGVLSQAIYPDIPGIDSFAGREVPHGALAARGCRVGRKEGRAHRAWRVGHPGRSGDRARGRRVLSSSSARRISSWRPRTIR